MKALKHRIQALWYVLTGRNFILLHSLKENGPEKEPGHTSALICRTRFSDKRDLFIMAGAIKIRFPGLHLQIPDEVEQEHFDSNGRYINQEASR